MSSFIRKRLGLRSKLQKGNALFVAVVLLLLASVVTLLALRVGVFEQRTSGNDLRAKLIVQVAEAGISQGAEYFRLRPTELAHSAKWALCDDADETFPCGSIPAARRGSMWYWNGGGGDINGDGESNIFDTRMLPLAGLANPAVPAAGMLTSVGAFDNIHYGVGVVVCRVANPSSASAPTACATAPDDFSNTTVYNFVSVAGMEGEATRTTISHMMGQYAIFDTDPNKPPIVASGSVDLTGTLQIVTNSNAGGPGVPVSVWTRRNVTTTGTPDTCYFDEFIRFGAQTNKPADIEGNPGIVTCDTCSCAGNEISKGSGGSLAEGMDILDIEPAGAHTGVNEDVVLSEFPCDLFQYVFGKKAWIDDDDGNGVDYLDKDGNPTGGTGDYFCESRAPQETYINQQNVSALMNADEAYLYGIATTIVHDPDRSYGGVSAESLLNPTQRPTYTYPSPNLSGIVWCQTGCVLQPGEQVGTPDKPVLLVIDANPSSNSPVKIAGRVFGLVFIRAISNSLDPTTGGDAIYDGKVLDMDGNAAVYGSVVAQGSIVKSNGTASIVFSSDVFKNFANSIPPKTSNLPGAWSDRLSY